MSVSFWWVNHSHRFRQEIAGSYLWFAGQGPQKQGAQRNPTRTPQKLLPGDVIFSFTQGEVGAIGVVPGGRPRGRPAN